jgi:hypothetical protein
VPALSRIDSTQSFTLDTSARCHQTSFFVSADTRAWRMQADRKRQRPDDELCECAVSRGADALPFYRLLGAQPPPSALKTAIWS